MTDRSAHMTKEAEMLVPKSTIEFIQNLMLEHWPLARNEHEWFQMHHDMLNAAVPAPSGRDPATIEAWISSQFFGHAVAVRADRDDSIPGEPFVSMAVAKDICRRALAAPAAQLTEERATP